MSVERPIPQESPDVTPDSLFAANRSPLSAERSADYLRAKADGKLVLFKLCADARSGPSLFDTSACAVDRSIAAGAHPNAYGEAIRYRGVGAIVIAPHFDSIKSADQGVFNGCGGQDAFRSINGADEDPHHSSQHPVASFIRKSVFSDNPFVQAFKQKDDVMGQFRSGDIDFKPIMIGAIDHRTGLFLPVWFIERDERGYYHTHGTLQSHHVQHPELITPDNLIPYAEELLPDHLRAIVESNKKYAQANPQFIETQRVQNPGTIIVTTSLIPLRNRYAGLFDVPNKVFVVGAPFSEGVDSGIQLADPSAIMSQISYPISNALDAQGAEDPFRDTNTIIFETESIVTSVFLAEEFGQTPWGQKWTEVKEGRILVVETKSGETKRALYYGE